MELQNRPDGGRQQADYSATTERVRELLRARLGGDCDNSERFGQGRFTFGMDYGDAGDHGQMIWIVTRYGDTPTGRREWRGPWHSTPPENVAATLIELYEELGRG
jgi:hypothetical protein